MTCTRDEAFERLMDYGVDVEFDFNEELEWWLNWSHRRGDQVAAKMAEVLGEIASGKCESPRFVAAQTMKRFGFKLQETNDG